MDVYCFCRFPFCNRPKLGLCRGGGQTPGRTTTVAEIICAHAQSRPTRYYRSSWVGFKKKKNFNACDFQIMVFSWKALQKSAFHGNRFYKLRSRFVLFVAGLGNRFSGFFNLENKLENRWISCDVILSRGSGEGNQPPI